MNTYAILLPAAGASSRMKGRDKLLEDINGEPLLRRIAKRAIATGSEVFVTLPEGSKRADFLADLDLKILTVPNPESGMSASFHTVAPHLTKNHKALLVVLPDMPDITGQDMALLLSGFGMFPDAPIVRAATPNGDAGHPVVLPNWLFKEFKNFKGDRGAGLTILKFADKTALIPLKDDRAIIDLDTPQDWQKWRANNQS